MLSRMSLPKGHLRLGSIKHVASQASATPLRPTPFTTFLFKRDLHTALFFPGHGVQRVGMANAWIEAFPHTAAKVLDEMDSTLGFKLSSIISDGPNSELNMTENSQPAIMAISVLILRILEDEEFSALVAGGSLEFRDALQLVRRRAEIMAQCTRRLTEKSGETFGMVALLCEPEHLEGLLRAVEEFLGLESPGIETEGSHRIPACQQVVVANINSKNQIVLSGSLDRIKILLVQLRQFGGHDPRAVRLKSDSPFHSPAMALAADYMRDAMEKINITFPASVPCVSNVSALPFRSEEDLKDLLSRQCTDTVRWWDSIRYLHQERGVKRWIGIGPGKVGRNLVGKEVGRVDTKGGGVWAICDPREMSEIMMSLEQTEIEVQGSNN
ncbi:Acyl transferase/acyl hydrolase/lysophospholipase [Penicillium paradoxum]|uniref:Acyl transferase/acyl hydrolase/lysophospholipase n=1 Tax=Penicillium paradoxum TaxID=176176 RepID=UPI0025467863|nr:Acyl transferase/acyl hydrolase/lysophospholipase [Penicillium paradoxum]KAJ5787424.1 Acyl transferase/acyl hydrolase/lysophospholipase [Penicillium paradoxum]